MSKLPHQRLWIRLFATKDDKTEPGLGMLIVYLMNDRSPSFGYPWGSLGTYISCGKPQQQQTNTSSSQKLIVYRLKSKAKNHTPSPTERNTRITNSEMVQHYRVPCLAELRIPRGEKVPSSLDIIVDSETATLAYLRRQILEKLESKNVTLLAMRIGDGVIDGTKTTDDTLLNNFLAINPHRKIVCEVTISTSHAISDMTAGEYAACGAAAATGGAYGTGTCVGILHAVGLQAAGPLVGSPAASLMSYLGSVSAPSVFSTCQSIAMAGFGPVGVAVTTVGGAAVVGGLAYGAMNVYKNKTN
ncbi:hypothetical protein PSTT_13635 [Puccinia striiformis]|uniref:Uncharacterized protein n=2 Tax=Puccinia striiformis TaxID=27350 RepID=A0A2S4URF4_9BASI|nr:hypothetical protein PSTT_13635 [Puccinia striiformis]